MKVVVIGTGYVGLVSGACFADIGHDVTCIDKNPDISARLERGEIPIFEPGLSDVVGRNIARGRLAFASSPASSVPSADVVFIAVGTPPGGSGDADLSYVRAAAGELALCLSGYTVIATKSTVPVGTNRAVARIVRAASPDANFDVASVPEFLREGSAVSDFAAPDRIVVGTDNARAADVLRQLHQPLLEGRSDRFVLTGVETAELIKYSANAFLAVKITFINEIANLCERVGADVEDVARGMGLDSRVGRWGLSAGPGYGGSCFPKDTLALAHDAAKAGAPIRLVETAIEVNDARKKSLADRVSSVIGGSVAGKTVAVLGITFKANTDDVRDSPAIDLARGLLAAGAQVRVFDPEGAPHARSLLDGVTWWPSTVEAAAGAHVATIVTEWDHFKPGRLDMDALKAAMVTPVLVDFRNLFDPTVAAAAGFTYVSVGRQPALPEGA
ncbi:MAG: UDP-glucose/GDP-mannose dehydrogenase family protein [Proteobacteria bacterium]|nr:UDP-glucose/GDP-mannose dehydrogenase family protein [Pseudomonadota bacterium]MDA1059034.1 UDP-glucose/GDP-mannose dehydrogenase family protein [Pseudomonadota bacterium]